MSSQPEIPAALNTLTLDQDAKLLGTSREMLAKNIKCALVALRSAADSSDADERSSSLEYADTALWAALGVLGESGRLLDEFVSSTREVYEYASERAASDAAQDVIAAAEAITAETVPQPTRT